MDLKKFIRSIKDYPKKGILFRDITTLIKDPDAFNYVNDEIIKISKKIQFDKISAIEIPAIPLPTTAHSYDFIVRAHS